MPLLITEYSLAYAGNQRGKHSNQDGYRCSYKELLTKRLPVCGARHPTFL